MQFAVVAEVFELRLRLQALRSQRFELLAARSSQFFRDVQVAERLFALLRTFAPAVPRTDERVRAVARDAQRIALPLRRCEGWDHLRQLFAASGERYGSCVGVVFAELLLDACRLESRFGRALVRRL